MLWRRSTIALKGEVLNDVALDLSVVLLDEEVVFEFVLDGADVERGLPGRIGDEDDEGKFVRVFERGPEREGQRTERGFARAAETDDEKTLEVLIFEGVD